MKGALTLRSRRLLAGSLPHSRSLQVRIIPDGDFLEADPVITEAQSQTIQIASPEQAQTTMPPVAPAIPAPEIPEALPPSSTIIESDPGFINQVPEPSPIPPGTGKTIPTPAVVVSAASYKRLDAWLVLSGLFVVGMMAV